jgi:hypothetical protein
MIAVTTSRLSQEHIRKPATAATDRALLVRETVPDVRAHRHEPPGLIRISCTAPCRLRIVDSGFIDICLPRYMPG